MRGGRGRGGRRGPRPGGQRAVRGLGREARDEADSAERASQTAQPRSAFGGTVAHLPAYPPPDHHHYQGAKRGRYSPGLEFDYRVGVSRLQTYPRLARASSALGRQLFKNPVPLGLPRVHGSSCASPPPPTGEISPDRHRTASPGQMTSSRVSV